MLFPTGVMVVTLLPPRLAMIFVICVQLTGGSRLVVASRVNDVDELGQLKLKLPWEARLIFNGGGGADTVTVKSSKS